MSYNQHIVKMENLKRGAAHSVFGMIEGIMVKLQSLFWQISSNEYAQIVKLSEINDCVSFRFVSMQ